VSTVACGASLEEIEVMFGAKAVVSRLEIRRGCHVTVMESGKFLAHSQYVAVGRACRCVLVFHHENVVLASDSQLQPTLDQLLLADFAKTVGIACCTNEMSDCL